MSPSHVIPSSSARPEVSAMRMFGASGSGFTIIVPEVVAPAQSPVSVTVYVNVPVAVGVPEMVTVFEAHEPVTPAGRPVTVAPVASVVVYVIVVMAVFRHTVWLSQPVLTEPTTETSST
jgi:hypothetical protein